MLTEKVIRHVIESVREVCREEGWDVGPPGYLERIVRERATEINALILQIQRWAQTDDVQYEAICQLLDHLPHLQFRIDEPIALQIQIPIGELLRAVSHTGYANGEIEGVEVVPNECPATREDDADDGLEIFRRAFEE
jgi:hypothetical protein